jgi:hypothetical protein
VPFGRAFRIPIFCSRRDFPRRTGSGFGMLALSAMLARRMVNASDPAEADRLQEALVKGFYGEQ